MLFKKSTSQELLCYFFTFSSIILGIFSTAGCSKKEISVVPEDVAEIEVSQEKNYFQYFYFSKDGFSYCESPENSPEILMRPWTEGIRAGDSGISENGDGFLLVNKLGMMVFPEKKDDGSESQFFLMRDKNIFENGTAGNLVFSEGQPFFTLYKNSFFDKSKKTASTLETNASRPYIIRASVENNAFFPVITYADLGIEDGEVTSTFFDGNNWLSSVKTTSSDSTSFKYINWKPASSLLSMQPYFREGKISISEVVENDFRKKLEIKAFSAAPQRLKNLLGKVPSKIPFTVELKDSDGTTHRAFVSGEDSVIDSKAIISPQWICCIFEDGTVYFNGALKGRELANKGLNFAFRLPKLKNGFSYTYFTIAGSNLIAGWEENDFYKVGKSGFLVADLEKILYE